ncbi:FAD-binding and (Fe-S)-binding domain-containing protein [Corynebacterium epidermidicanis]|nr:FAD-binding and (Fe-S)-binding domain-containing protein [Corynebacterium epidermidicanis]
MTTRAAYVSDASIFRRVPAAIIEPKTKADIRDALDIARENRWPIVGRGGGTSVAGNAIGQGLIVDTSRYFNKILSIDPVTKTAVVEPGVVCDQLREAAAEYGLTYGPDPSTHSRCTVGGMVANNACGSHSVAWGTAADNIVQATVMLFDGREVTIRRGGVDDSGIDESLKELVNNHGDLIRQELGRFPRQVSGYGLHYLLPEHGFDVAKAFAGTEGTCGIITSLTVRLVEVPKAKALAVLGFDTVFDAARAAPRLRVDGVSTIEGMGGDLLDALRAKNGQQDAGADLPGIRLGKPAGGWLYCEVGGTTIEEAEAKAQELATLVPTVDAIVVTDPTDMRNLWHIREASAGIVTRLPDGGEAWPSWEDSAVPPENLADYLQDLYALMEQHDLRGIPFGHFGEGCVHVRISFDLGTDSGLEVFRSFMTQAAQLVAHYGGSLSGEHGDGRARSELLGHMYSPEMLALFEQFKHIFDPDHVFNPGVLVQPEPIDAGVRPGPGQRTFELTPKHAFSKDEGSFVNAVNRCVGVGACRSMDNAMCPSFQITHDEVHSTRGRARILSEMFRGESIQEGYRSEEVKEALDLCLSCKACASECPVNVDMATYKAEFLNQFYANRLRPMSHYLMGWLPVSARLLHTIPKAARLADMMMHMPGLRYVVAKLGGVDTSRPLIHLAPMSLQKWAKSRAGHKSTKKVVLWPDTFNNHLDTSAGQATVDLLEALGYQVIVPQGFVCCGLTFHSTGQLGMAERVLRRTAEVMRPYLELGLPVVAIEPSCTAMLQHEATELCDDPWIKRLAEQTQSWATFAADELRKQQITFAPSELAALTQVHCHERSLGDRTGNVEILAALGIDEETISTGCCGLAGNWGYEAGHAKMSFELGEREVFPRVRAHDGLVMADGFSCRTHIEQGTGVKPRHLAEVLAEALKKQR